MARLWHGTVYTPAKCDKIWTVVAATASLTTCQLAQQLGLSHTSFYCEMRSFAFPYKICIHHRRKGTDDPRRMEFCSWLLQCTRDRITVLETRYFFQIKHGFIWMALLMHKIIVCGVLKIHVVFAQLRYIPKKLVYGWQSLGSILLDNFFFSAMITGEVYQDIVQQFIAMLDASERDIIFQRDNARPHVARNHRSATRIFW